MITSRAAVIAAGVQTNEVNTQAFRSAAQPLLEKYLERAGLQSLYQTIQAAA
jgi:hypothetical protein